MWTQIKDPKNELEIVHVSGTMKIAFAGFPTMILEQFGEVHIFIYMIYRVTCPPLPVSKPLQPGGSKLFSSPAARPICGVSQGSIPWKTRALDN